MVRLPARLERQLQEIFPRVRERERFVTETIEEALRGVEVKKDMENAPIAIGGTLSLFTDGGSRGNPGQAAIGCLLVDGDGTILEEHAARIGIQTNNVAEYEALIAGLKLALKYRPNRLVCHLDSELVVKQLSGAYRVKMVTLQPLVEEIEQLRSQLTKVEFVHIPRKDNFRADALVNAALDGK